MKQWFLNCVLCIFDSNEPPLKWVCCQICWWKTGVSYSFNISISIWKNFSRPCPEESSYYLVSLFTALTRPQNLLHAHVLPFLPNPCWHCVELSPLHLPPTFCMSWLRQTVVIHAWSFGGNMGPCRDTHWLRPSWGPQLPMSAPRLPEGQGHQSF